MKEIRNIVELFMENILGNETPAGNCFFVCYPLSLYLEHFGFKTTLVAGRFKNTMTMHYWLISENYPNVIIDPTIKQFYEHWKDDVHIGEKPKDYNEVHDNNWFKQAYESWLNNLTNQTYIQWTPELDINALIKIYFSGATLLYNKVKKTNFNISLSTNHSEYFNGINKMIVYQWAYSKEILKKTMPYLPRGFDNLLSQAVGQK